MKKKYAYLFAILPLLLISSLVRSQDYALLIAVDQYEHWSSLNNPVKDAKAIGKDLKDIYGFNVEVLENATQRKILEKLKAYQEKTYSEKSQLFIFFSGHGEFFKNSREGFFIPKDGQKNDDFGISYLPHDRLESNIDAIPCKHILLAIDACFSGTFDKAIALMKGNDPFRRPGELPKEDRNRFIERSLRTKSRLYLTSGGKERTPDGINHSPFVEKFLEGLRSYGGDDFILTYNELISYMEYAVPEPRTGQFGSHEISGKFLFIGRNKKYGNTTNNTVNEPTSLPLASSNTNTTSNFLNSIQSLLEKGEFSEAVKAVQHTPSTSNTSEIISFYIVKGKVYNTIAHHVSEKSVGDLPAVKNPAIQAFDAFHTALRKNQQSIPSDKSFTTQALDGISQSQGFLYTLGNLAYEGLDYEEAYQNYQTGLRAHDILKENGVKSTLDERQAFLDQKYLLGLAALNGKKISEAGDVFRELYNVGYEKPAVYEALYNITVSSNSSNLDLAYQYIREGRQKYPEEVSLLFAEINHFLKIGKLEELIEKLKIAIQKEPQNHTLYVTMGSVYDNLYQKEFKEGNQLKAEDYFNLAIDYYNQVLRIDSRNFDGLYSIGALYYNRAANMTVALNELANDFSKEGMKKYEDLKSKIFAEFEKALPYFQKAESVDPNSVNTLIALKEIYSRKEDLATSNQLKTRLERVQNGGSNPTSYFKL